MIGEGVGELGKAAQATEEDEKSKDKETPEEEMEKLEAEDHQRVEALDGEYIDHCLRMAPSSSY